MLMKADVYLMRQIKFGEILFANYSGCSVG